MSTNGKLLVSVVGTAPGLADVLEALAACHDVEVVSATERAGGAAAVLETVDVDTVLFATEGPEFDRDELSQIERKTSAPVIVLAADGATGVLGQALEADVADAVLLPQPVESLLFSIRKATGRRDGGGPAVERGRIITVFSPKGGTGKSAIATNLATAFAHRPGSKTLLVDLDLQFGDSAVMLGLEPERTILDLVSAPGELDPDKLSGYTVPHSSGLDLLAAPARPEEAELVPVAKLVRLLEVARESYELVVLDTAPVLHGPVLAGIDHTDELLVVAILDVPTLKDVRQSLETLELLNFPERRISLVLNRADAPVGIRRGEVEAAFGRRFRFALPEDRAVPLAVNRAVPVVLAEPKAEFSRAVRQLAGELAQTVRPRREAVAGKV